MTAKVNKEKLCRTSKKNELDLFPKNMENNSYRDRNY